MYKLTLIDNINYYSCTYFDDKPSLACGSDIPSDPTLFHAGEIGDLGDEDDPGEARVILFPRDEEKLLLLLLLLRLSSLGVLSDDMLTNGPFELKWVECPFWSTERDLSRPDAGDGDREALRVDPAKLPPLFIEYIGETLMLDVK